MRINWGKHAADWLVAAHLVWGIFAVASLPAVLFWPGTQGFVFWALIVMVGSWALWRDCPLTAWERNLRARFDPAGFYDHSEGFLSRYLARITGLRLSGSGARTLNYAWTAIVLLAIIIR